MIRSVVIAAVVWFSESQQYREKKAERMSALLCAKQKGHNLI
jgi:hypothetical protein